MKFALSTSSIAKQRQKSRKEEKQNENPNPKHSKSNYKNHTATASAILIVALVSSRTFWIRQPTLPITFPICFEGTTILKSTSWAFACLLGADTSEASKLGTIGSSSRRRFPVTVCPGSETNKVPGKGIETGRGAMAGMEGYRGISPGCILGRIFTAVRN